MLELILIGVITYYAFLFFFFYKCSFRKFWEDYFPSAKVRQVEIVPPEVTIIITKEILSDPQKGTIPLKIEQEIDKTEEANKFVSEAGEDQIESIKIDYGYPPESDESDNENIPEWEESTEGYASGVTFDEIKLLVGVITEEEKQPEGKEKEVVEILYRLRHTDLYHQIVEQIQEGEGRVNKLLDRYLDAEEKTNMTILENQETENFDINNYLPDGN